MVHQFSYNGTVSYNDSLIVEDLGNTCIEAVDELGYCYYFITRTKLGITSCLEYGPLNLDDNLLPDESNIKFSRFEFSNNAIIKKIVAFLGPKKSMMLKTKKVKIIQALEKSFDEVIEYGVNMFEYFKDEEKY